MDVSTHTTFQMFLVFHRGHTGPLQKAREVVVDPQQKQRQSVERVGILVNLGSAFMPSSGPHPLIRGDHGKSWQPHWPMKGTKLSRGQARSSTGFLTWTSGVSGGKYPGAGDSVPALPKTPSWTLALCQALSQGPATEVAPGASGGSLRLVTISSKIPHGE